MIKNSVMTVISFTSIFHSRSLEINFVREFMRDPAAAPSSRPLDTVVVVDGKTRSGWEKRTFSFRDKTNQKLATNIADIRFETRVHF